MLISDDTFEPGARNISPALLPGGDLSSVVFFDIETTGLSWRTSHLYLIGAAWMDGSVWHIRQWFLQKPSEEPGLLDQFSDFLKGFSRLIHYNGQTFDLPYLRHKYSFYRRSCPLDAPESTDLYRLLHPFRKLFSLSSLKQKDVERLLAFPRQDRMDGGELIGCYRKYLQTGSEELYRLMLLHNHDDVLGMVSLLPLLACPALFRGHFSAADARQAGDELQLLLLPELPLPLPLRAENELCSLAAEGNHACITVPGVRETMKHFFPDYKNYFYLPLEDTAVHKSIGIYVDAEHRQKAKADTCYQKTEGLFFPQPAVRFQPDFYREYRQAPSFFRIENSWPGNEQELKNYACDLLQRLL